MSARSEEIHHALYQDEHGSIRDREIIGQHIFPVCKACHTKSNPKGCHGKANWISGQGNGNRNTTTAYDRLQLGYKLLM
jgi:hypothetical protein